MLFSAIYDIYSVFNEYNSEAIRAAMVAICIYIVAMVVVFVIRSIKGLPHKTPVYVLYKLGVFVVFGIYFSYLTCLTLSGREAGSRGAVMNLVPFVTIVRSNRISINLFENIILFIPFGVLVPMLWNYIRSLTKVTIAGFAASTLIETLQIITGRGYFDIDDIILNSFGTVIGYAMFAGLACGYYGVKRRMITDVCNMLNIPPRLGSMYNRRILANSKRLFIVQAVPVAAWYTIVMEFSSNNGYESGFLSRSLLYNILVMTNGLDVIAGVTSDTDEQLTTIDMLEKILRKIAHLTEYAILAVLIWIVLYSIRRLGKAYVYILTIGLVGLASAIDEINQSTVVGRYGTYIDVVIDLVGACIAMAITAIVMKKISNYYQKKYLRKLKSY